MVILRISKDPDITVFKFPTVNTITSRRYLYNIGLFVDITTAMKSADPPFMGDPFMHLNHNYVTGIIKTTEKHTSMNRIFPYLNVL